VVGVQGREKILNEDHGETKTSAGFTGQAGFYRIFIFTAEPQRTQSNLLSLRERLEASGVLSSVVPASGYSYRPLRSRHGEHRDNINLKNRETTILEKYSSFRDRISQAI